MSPSPNALPSRTLSALEREVSVEAMLAQGVGSAELCERAAYATRLLAREPRAAEVRGPRSAIAHVALSTRADGITLGRAVFVRRSLVGPDDALPLDLVAHEVTHVAQVLREGVAGFYLRYLAEYAKGQLRGLGDHAAYLAISYEVEARAVGTRVRISRPAQCSARPAG